jgi:hypothetical protein
MSMETILEYGKIGLITHFAISWSFLGCAYLLVSRSKNPQKIIKYFKLENKIPEKAGSFMIAGIIYKVVMPIRIGVSIIAIPLVIKLLGED